MVASGEIVEDGFLAAGRELEDRAVAVGAAKASCDKIPLMDVVVTMVDFVYLASDLEADAAMGEKILPRS